MIVKPIRISNPYRFLRKRQLTLGIGRLVDWGIGILGYWDILLRKIFLLVLTPQSTNYPIPQLLSQPITKGN